MKRSADARCVVAQQLPTWVNIVVSLTPAIVTFVLGGVGAYIAALQYRIHRDKLRLDLFTRRLEIFEQLQECVSNIINEPDPADRSQGRTVSEIWGIMHRARFLFGPDVHEVLRKISDTALEIRTLRDQLFYCRNGMGLWEGKDREKQLAKLENLVGELLLAFPSMTEVFERYLSFGNVRVDDSSAIIEHFQKTYRATQSADNDAI